MANRPSDFFGTASPKSVLNKPFMHLQDQKAYNVDGGSSIADAWTTRDLNTVIHNDIQGASLAANAVTLPAGTYYVEGGAPFVANPAWIAGILGVFVGSDKVLQQESLTIYGNEGQIRVSGVITLATSSSVTLKYMIGVGISSTGLGYSNNAGSITDASIPSIYADLKIWQLDRSLEVAPKAVNSGLQTVPSLDTTGNIMGFDISKTGANEVTVTKGSTLDSTLEVPMALTVDTALAIPTVANTIYHIFLVRLVADGTFTVKAYTTEAGVASDTLVDKWRWIGFWRTNGSMECVVATMRGDYLLFTKASENVVSVTITTTPATVDHSAFIPESRVELIEYGVRDASNNSIIYAIDTGSDASFVCGVTNSITSDASYDVWGRSSGQKASLKPYLATREFAGTAGTLDLLIHAVKLRR